MTTVEILDDSWFPRGTALRLLVEHEWCADGRCPECNEWGPLDSITSLEGKPFKHEPKHAEGCEWGAIVAEAKRDPLFHFADNDSEECETLCESRKNGDTITTKRADVTSPTCKERNEIKP